MPCRVYLYAHSSPDPSLIAHGAGCPADASSSSTHAQCMATTAQPSGYVEVNLTYCTSAPHLRSTAARHSSPSSPTRTICSSTAGSRTASLTTWRATTSHGQVALEMSVRTRQSTFDFFKKLECYSCGASKSMLRFTIVGYCGFAFGAILDSEIVILKWRF